MAEGERDIDLLLGRHARPHGVIHAEHAEHDDHHREKHENERLEALHEDRPFS